LAISRQAKLLSPVRLPIAPFTAFDSLLFTFVVL
jgi:hypothetical protein